MPKPALLIPTATAVLLLTGCVPNTPTEAMATVVAVESTADDCLVDTDTVASGTVTFSVNNSGDRITEFYLLGDDELSIVSEVENIAPGTSRDLTVVAQPGDYFTVCKPGMIGEGIGRAAFTVTGGDVAIAKDEAIVAAVANYTAYVKDQVAELLPRVRALVDAYEAGDVATAKALFPIARINYERIEPTASSFGVLDPKIDYRKPGADAEGLEFTGFHRIEMDLWLEAAITNYPDEAILRLDPAGRAALGDRLVEDVQALYDAVHDVGFVLSISDITNGAIGLLDEVAAPDGKLPGEENEFAHTDLYDFYANIEGAEVAYHSVRDIALTNGRQGDDVVSELDAQFTAMKALLSTYGSYESGFVSYDTVDQDARNELGAQLNALSEPLAKLTFTVLGAEQAG